MVIYLCQQQRSFKMVKTEEKREKSLNDLIPLKLDKRAKEALIFPWCIIVLLTIIACWLLGESIEQESLGVFYSSVSFFTCVVSVFLSFIYSGKSANEFFKKQAKECKEKKNWKSRSFIFTQLVSKGFYITLGIDLLLMFFIWAFANSAPETAFPLSIVLQIVTPQIVCSMVSEHVYTQNSCPECHTLWSYMLIDEKMSEPKEYQDIRYTLQYDTSKGKEVERPEMVRVREYDIYRTYKCKVCEKEITKIEHIKEESGTRGEKPSVFFSKLSNDLKSGTADLYDHLD